MEINTERVLTTDLSIPTVSEGLREMSRESCAIAREMHIQFLSLVTLALGNVWR